MLVSLLTLGCPEQLSGGYLYHCRLAELAGDHDAEVEFVPVRLWPDPFTLAHGDVVLVDSIAAWLVAPWAQRGANRRRPLAAILHQPPGGIDNSAARRRIQAGLDRNLYRRCGLLIAASESLREDLVAPPHRLPADCIRVIAPGSDVAAMPTGPVPDLRHGRRAAAVSVGNWMARKGVLELLDALGRLPHDRVTLHLVGRDDVEPAYTERVRGRLAVLGDRVVHHGVLDRTASPASTPAPTSSCCPAGGNRTARSTARPWPLACRSSGGGLATCLTSSATESREWSSTRAMSRPSPPHSTGWPATSCGGPPWRGRRAAEALRCRDGATPRQHSSWPSGS
jgi:glycosyltransferase involved in cell wall biosynthesis